VCAARFALATFHWTGSQRWRREIFFTQRLVERHSLIFILRGKGTAPNQVARPTTLRVPRDTFPQHVQHTGVAILLLGNREKTGLGFSLSPWLSHIQKRGPGKLQQFTDIGASTSFSYVASFLPAASQCFIQLN